MGWQISEWKGEGSGDGEEREDRTAGGGPSMVAVGGGNTRTEMFAIGFVAVSAVGFGMEISPPGAVASVSQPVQMQSARMSDFGGVMGLLGCGQTMGGRQHVS